MVIPLERAFAEARDGPIETPATWLCNGTPASISAIDLRRRIPTSGRISVTAKLIQRFRRSRSGRALD